MATQKIHVVPHEEGWAVKLAGESNPTSVRPTKKQALSAGKTLALVEETAVVVHRPDGAFDNVIPFRQVQEEAEKSLERAAETLGTTPRVRPDPSGCAESLLGGRREERSLGWPALLVGGATVLVLALSVKCLVRMVAGWGRDQEGSD